jgi:hypothetical protein
MNRPRIVTGTFGSAACVAMGDILFVFVLGDLNGAALSGFLFPLVFVAPAVGFVLTYLYVLARPRLGPGPKTALWTGLLVGAIWALAAYPAFALATRTPFVFVFFMLRLFSCLAGCYLAGWQYMDGPPE